MKNSIYIALITLATIQVHAQNVAVQNRALGETGTTLAQDYADQVNGLLRNVHAALQRISERMEAGELTPEQARDLKLAATRDLIARLETISAVYDARIAAQDVAAQDARASSELSATTAVSVANLRKESAR